jgi:hypothetical protein
MLSVEGSAAISMHFAQFCEVTRMGGSSYQCWCYEWKSGPTNEANAKPRTVDQAKRMISCRLDVTLVGVDSPEVSVSNDEVERHAPAF